MPLIASKRALKNPATFARFAPLAGLLMAFWASGPAPAGAHDWYPVACCSDQDCVPVDGEVDVSASAEGWVIHATGEVIAYDDRRIRTTPADVGASYHRCSMGGKPQGRTICLFVPGMGS